MANNRLYIVDDETGESIMIAKSFGNGWCWWPYVSSMERWLSLRDIGASYGGPAGMTSTKLRLVTEYDMPNDLK